MESFELSIRIGSNHPWARAIKIKSELRDSDSFRELCLGEGSAKKIMQISRPCFNREGVLLVASSIIFNAPLVTDVD